MRQAPNDDRQHQPERERRPDARPFGRAQRAQEEAHRLDDREDREEVAIAEIAAELHMSVGTVKAQVSRLLGKLDVENRIEIALLVQDATRGRPGGQRS